MSEINPGDIVTVRTNPPFNDGSGPADPTTVSVVWRRRGAPPTTWVYGTDDEVVKDGTGDYHADIPITKAGTYYFRWVGTGVVTAAEEDTFEAISTFF